jgi:membrane protease YdiL (CAAX protease family)
MEVMGYYLAVIVVSALLARAVSGLSSGADPLLIQSVAVAGSALLIALALSRLTRWSWTAQGWRKFQASARGFGLGAGIGLAMAVAACGASLVLGARLRLEFAGWGALAVPALSILAILLAAALGEELLFRGFPLVRLSAAIGRLRASVVLAALFALLHLGNPGLTLLGGFNVMLAGLVMSAAFFGAGGLAAAWGLHFGWNAGLGVLFEAPVSGVEFDLPLSDYAPGGTWWITGGSFGPEGGLVSTVAFLGVLWVWRRRLLGEDIGG